jgi:hypothetical protein
MTKNDSNLKKIDMQSVDGRYGRHCMDIAYVRFMVLIAVSSGSFVHDAALNVGDWQPTQVQCPIMTYFFNV